MSVPSSAQLLPLLDDKPAEKEVREQALLHDYAGDTVESALVLARLLLFRDPKTTLRYVQFPVQETAFDKWRIEVASKDLRLAHMQILWLLVNLKFFGTYPIFLYNKNYGDTRVVFHQLLTSEANPPGYMYLLYLNMFRQVLGYSHNDLSYMMRSDFVNIASVFNELFSNGDKIREWLSKKKQSLMFYAGETNTVLGLYEKIFQDKATGVGQFNRHADVVYDLGGGFNTSQIEQLIERRCVSADLLHPDFSRYDADMIIMKNTPNQKRWGPADVSTRELHLSRQRQVEHLPFNVLKDSFPDNANSYSIISAGFMTSTGRAREDLADWYSNHVSNLALSVMAMKRVMELVQTGKSVDLFTVQRATSLLYKYKTAMLQWRNGRLVNMVTTDDTNRFSPHQMQQIQLLIDPDKSQFNEYLEAK